MIRASSDHERAELKAALRAALLACGGGENAQTITRVNKAALSRYGSAGHPDMHVPLDVMLDLDRFAEAPILLRALARLLGYRIRPAAQADGAGPTSPMGVVGDLAREHADVIAAIAEAHADGRWTEAELRTIEAEAHELQGVVNAVFAAVRATRADNGEGGGP